MFAANEQRRQMHGAVPTARLLFEPTLSSVGFPWISHALSPNGTADGLAVGVSKHEFHAAVSRPVGTLMMESATM